MPARPFGYQTAGLERKLPPLHDEMNRSPNPPYGEQGHDYDYNGADDLHPASPTVRVIHQFVYQSLSFCHKS